jgi:hypothetical protein
MWVVLMSGKNKRKALVNCVLKFLGKIQEKQLANKTCYYIVAITTKADKNCKADVLFRRASVEDLPC